MGVSEQYFNPSEAAARLGVSVKALRLYEQRGLVMPVRSEAGWRAYGPQQMARIGEVVALRALGLTLAQVARLLNGDEHGLDVTLQAHQGVLETQLGRLAAAVDKVRVMRTEIAAGKSATLADLVQLADGAGAQTVAFELPWPWGGERFELRDLKTITYIIGSLGSGKTRLAMRLAEVIDDACFVGLERDGGAAAARLETDPALKAAVEHSLAWLVEDGGEITPALVALLVAIMGVTATTVVVDMVEQDLGQETQQALAAYFRTGGMGKRLMLMTRSSALLDLDTVGPNEAIILCPANHSVPRRVLPFRGAEGYESVANCLATPEVRARTAGVVAMRRP
ncbi:MAG: MerR family transcriptional regulator [Cypionkella sp.]